MFFFWNCEFFFDTLKWKISCGGSLFWNFIKHESIDESFIRTWNYHLLELMQSLEWLWMGKVVKFTASVTMSLAEGKKCRENCAYEYLDMLWKVGDVLRRNKSNYWPKYKTRFYTKNIGHKIINRLKDEKTFSNKKKSALNVKCLSKWILQKQSWKSQVWLLQ